MKVKDVMTGEARTCDLNASLTDAAKTMWDHDCGILPVLKNGKEIVGVVTDRDICMGTAMRDRNPSSISVEEVMTGAVYTVMPDDKVDQALETMRQHQIRRLPVVDSEGQLQGMLSINDITLRANDQGGRKAQAIPFREVMKTYQAICAHPLPVEVDDRSMTAKA